MSENIKIIKKTFHQYVITEEIVVPKKDLLKEFDSVEQFRLQLPFCENKTEDFLKNYKFTNKEVNYYTEKRNAGYSIEYDVFDGDKILTLNNF
jgi:hypothetical protein